MVRILHKFGIVFVTTLLLILVACSGSSDDTTEAISTLEPTPTVSPTVTPTSIPTHTPTPESITTPIEAVTPAQSEVTSVSTPASVPTPVPTEETTTPNPESEPMICSFNGYVAIDNASVPDDTVITAWIDGDLVGSAATESSAYTMAITGEYTGKVVTFKIGTYKAAQTAIWQNSADITIGLSVHLGPPVCRFYGTVTRSGSIVPDGTPISAWVGGTVVGKTTVNGSWYDLLATGEYSGKTVSFTVGSDQATETSIWERGGNEDVDLTVVVP